jgi:single-strand DNA-binding protein
MASLNRVCLLGNVGSEPEVRQIQSGSSVANFSIATSEQWTDKHSGERKEKTEWHRVTVWNDKLVAVIEKYVHKGSRLYVEGKLQTRKWTDKDGQDRYSTEIVLQGFDGKLVMCGDSGNRAEQAPAQRSRPTNSYAEGHGKRRGNDPISSGPQRADDMDDDIPF